MKNTLLRESQYARSLIEASRDPLVTISIEGKITDMNEAFTRITAKSRDELTGTDFFTYFTEPGKARKVYEDVFSKGFVVDYPLTMRDRTLTDVLFNGSVYKDEIGKVLGAVVVARDITDQKRIETELIEAKVFAELATGIAEQAKIKAENATKIAEEATLAAEHASRIAEDAVKAKQQFLSNMSHEIRTPMNAILGFTKVVLKTPLTLKQKEYLNAIKISGDALIVLINDILDLAKVDAGKMTFEYAPFRLAGSISSMLELFQLKVEEKNLRLIRIYDETIPPILVGDAIRLHQVILNLVSNAVKFTHEGSITVSVQLLSEDEEKVTIEFSVTDTGIGIPAHRIPTIFENFQQASSETSRLYGGTGLGLAIVKHLLEPQGGHIEVISTPDVGSTFRFTLDFRKTTAKIEPEPEMSVIEDSSIALTVLVVEDIPLNQLLMQTLLDDFGFECDIAANGKIALEMLKTKSYDVILMDLQMPEMNGFQATEHIRNDMHISTPIIALTADVTTVDLAKCTEVGMNDYIAKPVNERLLFSKITSHTKKSLQIRKPSYVAVVTKPERCTNLDYLLARTRARPDLMMKMMLLYIEQTPILLNTLKQSMRDKNWSAMHSVAHKLIPSFSIVGMQVMYENMAKKIQEYAGSHLNEEHIAEMIQELDTVCSQACHELQEDYTLMKNVN